MLAPFRPFVLVPFSRTPPSRQIRLEGRLVRFPSACVSSSGRSRSSTTLCSSNSLLVPRFRSHDSHLPLASTSVLAANRDEFLGRPTSPAAWHDFTPSSPHFPTPTSTQRVLSGIDIEAGGTWLGVSLPSSSPPPSSHRKSLRFATLTNFTESLAPGPSRPSRGKLVKEFLETDASLEEYLERLRDELDEFAGFNLLVGEMRGEEMRVGYATNRDEDGERKKPRVLEKNGVRGVSNSTLKTVGLGEEEWPKVTSGCAAFREVVQREGSDDDELVAGLWDVLR